MTDYADVLRGKYPGARWSLSGNDYDTLEWYDDTPKPSQEELDAAWPQVQYEQQRAAIETQRRNAYTQEADPLFFSYQRGEATEQDWLDAVESIKARYPYPEAP
jgi:hypothetical protein